MPKYDLSQAADFSLLTQGALTDAAALFGGTDPANWDIVEGMYNGVPFHVFQSKDYVPEDGPIQPLTWQGALSRISDIGGRRKVKYQFPYKDGQTTDDLGKKPTSYELDILIFGPRYLEGLKALLVEFNKPTPGTLTHPVYGDLTCVVDDLTFTHQSEQRKAVSLRATFIEHNFTVGDISELGDDSNIKSALSKALAVFATVDAAINKVVGAVLLATGVKNLLVQYLNIYKQSQAQALTQMNLTFNSKGGSSDIPALLPVNLGGTGVATTSNGGVVTVATAPNSAKQAALGSTSSFATTGKGDPGNASKTGAVSVTTTSTFPLLVSGSDPFNGIPAAQLAQLSQTTVAAISAAAATKAVAIIFTQLGSIISTIETNGAYLELFDTIISMRQTAVLLQTVLETGIASSNARLIQYTTPRLMSLREVGWANGIPPDRVQELDILNPKLLSINQIAIGTILQVPAA